MLQVLLDRLLRPSFQLLNLMMHQNRCLWMPIFPQWFRFRRSRIEVLLLEECVINNLPFRFLTALRHSCSLHFSSQSLTKPLGLCQYVHIRNQCFPLAWGAFLPRTISKQFTGVKIRCLNLWKDACLSRVIFQLLVVFCSVCPYLCRLHSWHFWMCTNVFSFTLSF